ncbi:MAG: hypothetical protein ACAI38_03650 [Myxococcota bacterium]
MTAREPFDDYDIEEMARAARSFTKQVVRATRQHPYVALGAAVGLGFLLGGGLRSRTGKALLAVAARFALPQIETAVMSVVSRFQDSVEPSPDPAPADMAQE